MTSTNLAVYNPHMIQVIPDKEGSVATENKPGSRHEVAMLVPSPLVLDPGLYVCMYICAHAVSALPIRRDLLGLRSGEADEADVAREPFGPCPREVR